MKNIQLCALVSLIAALSVHPADHSQPAYSRFSLLDCAKLVTGTTFLVVGAFVGKYKSDEIKSKRALLDRRQASYRRFIDFVESTNRIEHRIPLIEHTLLNLYENAKIIANTTTDEGIKQRYYELDSENRQIDTDIATLKAYQTSTSRRFEIAFRLTCAAGGGYAACCLIESVSKLLSQARVSRTILS